MTLLKARVQARNFSKRYCTYWYVRLMEAGTYQPWAHSTESVDTVASFYCGDEI